MLSAIANFVGVYFLTNYLGATEYGTLVWVIAIMTSINVVADLGFDSAHVKRMSEGKDQPDHLSTFLLVKGVLILIMVAITISYLFLWPYISGETISTQTSQLLSVFTIYFIIYDLAAIFSCTFLAREEIARYTLITLADPLVRVPITVYLSVNHASIQEVAVAFVGGAIMMLVVALVLFARSNLRFGRPNRFANYATFAFPVSTITIITILSTNLDKVLIGVFASSEAVGYYTAAFTLMLMISTLGGAVANVTFPTFSRFFSEGRLEMIRTNTYQAERFIALIISPVIVFAFIFSELIITTLFGSGFTETAPAMRILTIAIFLNTLNGIYVSHIYSFNLPKVAAKINLCWFILDIILLLVLVPKSLFGVSLFGLSFIGAALAYLISIIVSFTMTRSVTHKLSGTRFNEKVLPIIACACVAGVIALLLRYFIDLPGLMGIVVYTTTVVISYVSLAYVTKILSREDVDYLLDVINLRKMLRYVRSEVKRER